MEEVKEHLIREAINNGISSNSIYDALHKMFGSKSLDKYTSRQIKLVINNICDMKIDTASDFNSSYSSELVKKNHRKIIDALKKGISPEEVANKLIRAVKDKNISKDDFKYLIILVANLKKKDLRYIKDGTKIYQKTID